MTSSMSSIENKIICVSDYFEIADYLAQIKVSHPLLIVYDISKHFYSHENRLTPRMSIEKLYDLDSTIKMYSKELLKPFLLNVRRTITLFQRILNSNGFLTVQVNGTIKVPVKRILDSIFSQEQFMNEIILDSPFKIKYNNETSFFERTEYFLLYNAEGKRRINPVYDTKESGGYWHSFVSKGQGSSKDFLIDGKIITLDPPRGTHWKLKQETILQLCKEGIIRLNRKGNPEYWVPPKIGQIIDTNWLDLSLTNTKNFQDSFYSRLYKFLLKPNMSAIIVNPRDSDMLIDASKHRLQWICVIKGKMSFKSLKKALAEENIVFKEYNTREVIFPQHKKHVELPRIEVRDISQSSIELECLSARSIYPADLNSDSENQSLHSNLLIRADCLNILHLLRTKFHQAIKLIYIDPPFYTGYDELISIPLPKGKKRNQAKTQNSKTDIRTIAYKNVLSSDKPIETFKRWFKDRVILMKPLLRLDGFIFVRFDYHFGHYAKEVLDDIFGESNFVIEFIIRRMKKNLSEKQLNQQTHLIVHSDSLFVYRGSNRAKLRDYTIKKSTRKNQNVAEIEYLNDNLWIDITGYQKIKRTIYPTENSERLLRRVIDVATEEGDLVADFFAGSGTTFAIAEQQNRKWLGGDISLLSINEIRKRILQIRNRSSFGIYDETPTIGSEREIKFKIKTKIQKEKTKHGTRIVLSLINLEYPVPLHDLEHLTFKALIDYWEIDWDYNEPIARIYWNSFRKLRGKEVLEGVSLSASHNYIDNTLHTIWVYVVDILGNECHKTIKVDLHNNSRENR
jgi:adenine specific DNA methylase Mod